MQRIDQMQAQFTTLLTPDGEEPLPPGVRSNINEETAAHYRSIYGDWVKHDHIFHFVYGILHSRDYRERYATDLARMLPRIPDLADWRDFFKFSLTGSWLMSLHIEYDHAPLWPSLYWDFDIYITPGNPIERYRVERMRWAKGEDGETDHTAIEVSPWLTIRGIPERAREYEIGPRSALDWYITNYRVRKDPASGIVNDVNDWGLELDPPRPDYIVQLCSRLTTVSMYTLETMDAMPPLRESDEQPRSRFADGTP